MIRCELCGLKVKPGHKCRKCGSCHNPIKSRAHYCEDCKELNIRCKVCKRLFMSQLALQGHRGRALH